MERTRSWDLWVFAALVALGLLAPLVVYPVFLMKVLCFALFACAFNLLIGYVGLLSFGHAMFFGFAAYVAGHLAKVGTVSLPYGLPFLGWKWLVIPIPPLTPELAILGGVLVAALMGVIVGADGVLLVRAGQVHGRRGWHPGHSAPAAPWHSRSRQRSYFLLCRAGDL